MSISSHLNFLFNTMGSIKAVRKVEEDKDIDDALTRVTAQHKGSKKIEEDRKTKKGDTVIFDFKGRTADDNKEHEGMQADDFKLELGSNQFIPGFEDQMIDHKAGEEFDVKVSFPKEYQAPDLAGRDAIFEINLKEIHETTEAVVNDEFAKELGFDDENALRDAIKNQLSSDYANQTRLKMKRQLLDVLDENHQFDLPQAMVDAELEAITKQIEAERAQNPDQDALDDEEKEELQTIAVRRVRLGLVIAEIGQQNNVTVADPELQQAVIREAQKYPGQEKMVFEFYQKNPQMLENLRAPLFEDKVVDILFDQAEVTEKEISIEELMKDDEEDAPKAKKSSKKTSGKKAVSKKADKENSEPKKETAKKSASKKTAAKKTAKKTAKKA